MLSLNLRLQVFCTLSLICVSSNCGTIYIKIAIKPNFDMDNSKIELIFPYFFIFIFIFGLISQKWLKKSFKNVLLRFWWKLPYKLILIRKIHGSNSFSQIFSFRFSFLPRLVKNVLSCNLILIWRIQKSNSFFQNFSSSSSFSTPTFFPSSY